MKVLKNELGCVKGKFMIQFGEREPVQQNARAVFESANSGLPREVFSPSGDRCCKTKANYGLQSAALGR